MEPLSKLFGGFGRSLGGGSTAAAPSSPVPAGKQPRGAAMGRPSLSHAAPPLDDDVDVLPSDAPLSPSQRDSRGRFLRLPPKRRRVSKDPKPSPSVRTKPGAAAAPSSSKPAASSKPSTARLPVVPAPAPASVLPQLPPRKTPVPQPKRAVPPPPPPQSPPAPSSDKRVRPIRKATLPPPPPPAIVEMVGLGPLPAHSELLSTGHIGRRPLGDVTIALATGNRPCVWLTQERAIELMPGLERVFAMRLYEHWKRRREACGPLLPSLQSIPIVGACAAGIRCCCCCCCCVVVVVVVVRCR